MRKDRKTARSVSAPFPPVLFLAAASAFPVSAWAQQGPEAPAAPQAPPQPPATEEANPTEEDAASDAAEPGTPEEAPEQASGEQPPSDETESSEAAPAPGQSLPEETEEQDAEITTPGSIDAEAEPQALPLQDEPDFGAYPNPADDKEALEQQGEARPSDIQPDRVFAEEWWTHTRPTLEFHGNFRVRANLYHNFHLNRIDPPTSALWPRPVDDYYTDLNNQQHGPKTCTPDEVGSGTDDPGQADEGCFSPTQGGADMRFRIEPTIVISDNLRVRSQIDLLGNLVLGSTPGGYENYPASNGYGVAQRSGYNSISGSSNTQSFPVSGINSLQDAITVRRAWAEYETPFGELKFGRMPDTWGLGILYNAGDDIDGDYQSTADRIAFTTGLPSWSVYLAGAWDYQDEGAISSGFTPPGGQAYDLGQRDDVSRVNLMLYRRMDPQLEALALKKGKVVINGGIYLSYRWQRLANDYSGAGATCTTGANALGCEPGQTSDGLVRRGMKIWTPDVYAELKYKKFYTAIEFVTHQGSFDYLTTTPGPSTYDEGWRVNQWGFAGEIEQKLVEDRLKLGFYYGWASGDPDVESLVPTEDSEDQIGDNKIQTFRFNPAYRIDLILNRNLLSRVQGTYYFKPMAQYDFIKKASGMKLGGRAEAIWTRASQFMQTPGHQRDLGIELDATVYYQSKDGVLNDREDLTGGFFGMLQYGVMFPLGGLGYLNNQTPESLSSDDLKLKPAQMVRGFLGVAF